MECLFFFFFATEKSCCFFCCFQNKTKPWIWAQDYGQDWSSSRNNKEGVGCSFMHLIYLPIWSIIKRLPSGRLLECKRWMAVLSGCQNADQLRAKSEGQASPGGRCWLLVSILWLSSWILLRSSHMHSPWDPVIFSVLVWAPSQAEPETMVWVQVVSMEVQWGNERVIQVRKETQKLVLCSGYRCGQLGLIPLGTLMTF